MWPEGYQPPKAANKWRHLAAIFRNLGDGLALECENLEMTAELDEAFDELYHNYAQLVHAIQAGQEFIGHRFDAIDGGENAS